MPSFSTRRRREILKDQRDGQIESGRREEDLLVANSSNSNDSAIRSVILANPMVPTVILLMAQYSIVFIWELSNILRIALTLVASLLLFAVLYIAVSSGSSMSTPVIITPNRSVSSLPEYKAFMDSSNMRTAAARASVPNKDTES